MRLDLSLIHISINIVHKPTTQRVEGIRQEKERSSENEREGRGEKEGYVWPTSKKKFPTPYDRPNAISMRYK